MLMDVSPFPLPKGIIRLGLACRQAGYRGVQQESVFWRRNIWDSVGGFPDCYRYAGDYWLWTKFASLAPLFAVDAVLGGFCVRSGQLSQRAWISYNAEVSAIRRSIVEGLPTRSIARLTTAGLAALATPTRTAQKKVVKRLAGTEFTRVEQLTLEPDGSWVNKHHDVFIPVLHRLPSPLLRL
jgi:hypothetical protein